MHPTQINQWKKLLLKGGQHLFSGKNEKDMESLEKERQKLYTQIGQLAVDLDWLKKKTGHLS